MTPLEKLEANVAAGLAGATQQFRASYTRNKKAVDFHVAVAVLSAIQGTLDVLEEPGVTPELLREATDSLAGKLGMKKRQQ